MKLNFLYVVAAAALVSGCSSMQEPMGAAVDSDRDVLTGGPISGTTIKGLPQAVRNSLKQIVPHAEIADIDKVTRRGEVVFEISFTEPARNPKLFIAENGSVLNDGRSQAKAQLREIENQVSVVSEDRR